MMSEYSQPWDKLSELIVQNDSNTAQFINDLSPSETARDLEAY